MTPAIELIRIDKRFGSVHANKDVSLAIEPGSIHGIIGENGAGKSTLMSILFGFYHADSGEIRVKGSPVKIRSSSDAIALGIGMVHQHFMLVEPFTVLENVVLGAEGGRLIGPALAKARAELERLAADYELEVDPDAIVGELPVGLQQRVEILKALFKGAETLILDEPTGVLTPDEADHLFRILRTLKDQGKTVILITHKLREIMAITDRVSVMRRGELVATKETKATNVEELAELMVGRRVLLSVEKGPSNPGETVLEVKNLTWKDRKGVPRVDNVSFSVRKGEIVGIAGVSGNGQSELLDVIAGIAKPSSGQVIFEGKDIGILGDPRHVREEGLAHVPEDRQHRGLIGSFDAAESAILGWHHLEQLGKGFRLDRDKVVARARAEMEEFDVRPPDPFLKSSKFSGGNQQKLIIAREIKSNPDLLIVGQPTRGVDIGAIEYIHKRIIQLRDEGKAVLLVSVELDEIRSMSDRILVMFAGRIMGERGPGADERELGLLMAGVARDAA
ncbi:heme ABC transporter ATP-binding protein [Aestuariivirga litoralis]|uniref:Heme ABC transporter ATP-binding protein n=1 Tax=Aestuariivirga litoralis TaxID=2650924 RepID=A0A2W2B8M2_9HYPH|nr:ABC transporter ATP-binding protein [Aestuariivirga litoralis]PZF76654.1 heme ABC transporter ATP-binding protein [Aestuariivirga litoralis]